MPDVNITITIPDDKVSILTPWYLAGNPIPQISDPEWVDPNDGSVVPLVDEYNLKEWVKLELITHLKMICRRGKNEIDRAADLATWDDDIII